MQKFLQPNIRNGGNEEFHSLVPPHRGRAARVAVEDLSKNQRAENPVVLWAHERSTPDIMAMRADSRSD